MSSSEKIEAQRRLIEFADRINDGKVDMATAIWELYPDLCVLGLDSRPEFAAFGAFRSESDHLPLPGSETNWHPDAYAEKVKELKKIEAKYRERIEAACSLLIMFLGNMQC